MLLRMPGSSFWILLLLAVLTNDVCSDDAQKTFSQLSDKKKKELQEIYSKSDAQLVHQKLTDLRKQWMEKLKNEEAAQNVVQQRTPSRIPQKSVPQKDGPTVLPIHEINRNANLSQFMYQADIVLTLAQMEQITSNRNSDRPTRQAYRDMFYPNTIWGKTLYYYFDPTATDAIRTTFTEAARFWQENTCITFVEDSTAPNRVRVFKGDGCYSYVGRVGGQQDLSLGKGCESVGTAAHEIGHALGFFHSQSRVDRDSAIRIIVANIQPDFVDQFDKESATTNYNYGMPYDYGSIMQYGATSASRNGGNTMVAKAPDYQETMGSDMVAFYDVSMMNEHYNCKALCQPVDSAKCQNGGFPNPNNCTVCICPSGYGGTLCNERPPGCGAILTASETYQTMTSTVGDGTTKTQIDFTTCNYWIQAPAGKQIQIRMDSYQGYTADGCIYGGVEIKSHIDQLRTGFRLCSVADVGTTLTAASNLLPVITFNRYGRTTVGMSYRYIGGQQIDSVDPQAPVTFPEQTTRRTTIRPFVRCINYFYNCNVLAFFGYCDNPNVRQRCRRACRLC